MPDFRIYVAQDVVAFGSVTVEADNLDSALEKVDSAFVSANFEIHGNGSDDYDHASNRRICLTGWYNDDDDTNGDLDISLPDAPEVRTFTFIYMEGESCDIHYEEHVAVDEKAAIKLFDARGRDAAIIGIADHPVNFTLWEM